ncbi:MAG: hypothetical protein AAFV71_11785 [Cyanobacteria bacterium J06633_8]
MKTVLAAILQKMLRYHEERSLLACFGCVPEFATVTSSFASYTGTKIVGL